MIAFTGFLVAALLTGTEGFSGEVGLHGAELKALRWYSPCLCPALQAGTEYADGKDSLNGADGADELDNMGSHLHRRPKKYWPFSEGPRLVQLNTFLVALLHVP